jgi:2-amino-4-hydroxy-6-hydroxymethyldihydropteridine diphosphokinase
LSCQYRKNTSNVAKCKECFEIQLFCKGLFTFRHYFCDGRRARLSDNFTHFDGLFKRWFVQKMVYEKNAASVDVLIGIGANLVPDGFESPRDGCEAAIARFPEIGIEIVRISAWFETAPVPLTDQPWFVNAVIAARTKLSMHDTLQGLHRIEAEFGRVRQIRNEARVLDLDLLDFGRVQHDDDRITLPHPRMHERAFVLLPLRDVAPDYVHPVTGQGIADLVAVLPEDQMIRRMSG